MKRSFKAFSIAGTYENSVNSGKILGLSKNECFLLLAVTPTNLAHAFQ